MGALEAAYGGRERVPPGRASAPRPLRPGAPGGRALAGARPLREHRRAGPAPQAAAGTRLMPRRRELTVEEVRAAGRARTARWRAKQPGDVTVTSPGDVTAAVLPARANGHGRARGSFLVTPSPPEKERAPTTSSRCAACSGAPGLRPRRAAPRPVAGLPRRRPRPRGHGDGVVAVRHPKRLLRAFITNWVKQAATRPAPRRALGRVLQQIADDPVAGPSTWH